MRSFGREIYSVIITLTDVIEEEIYLKDKIDNFKKSNKPKRPDKKGKKTLSFENAKRLLKGRQKPLNGS